MRLSRRVSLGILGIALAAILAGQPALSQDWTHFVRIAGHSLSLARVDDIIKSATETHVFGIETDNDIPGRYESFLDPTEKLKAIQAIAEKAHAIGNRAFVYIAGLECITDHAERRAQTMFKDHPDWIQRKITGEPAIFGGGTAFWIAPGDEDVWISPYAPEWRKIYMQRVRQIAATGIDGIYVDIPYWMTHFHGWHDSWASFDDCTVAAFRSKTGLNAKTDIKLGDYNDPGFIQWIDFRIASLTDLMKEIDQNVKSINLQCKTIAEIYPGIEEGATRVGADVYQLYQAVDVIAHEYEFGHGDHMAASRTPLDWFGYMVGMYSFRSFAGDKASWMLNYSWDGQKQVDPREAMKNLAMAELMAGTNFWDVRGHVMSGSNDMETRKLIFKWIADHERTFFSPRMPIQPIGVYFSPKTRDYFPEEFIRSYRGILILLLQSHLEFQVVTPRNLRGFSGDLLILPDVRCLSGQELDELKPFLATGNTLMLTGQTGKFDEKREARTENALHKMLGIMKEGEKQTSTGPTKFIYEPNCPGSNYYSELERHFDEDARQGNFKGTTFERLRDDFAKELVEARKSRPAVDVQASPFVSTQIAEVNGKIHIFIANFQGLQKNAIARQTPAMNARIALPAQQNAKVFALPFLGEAQEVKGEWSDGKITCTIPEIEKGLVVWAE